MEMESTSGRRTSVADSYKQKNNSKRRNYSVFELPSNFLDSFRFVESISIATDTENTLDERETAEKENNFRFSGERWRCNTCNSSFKSLHDQLSHFKSDFHRFNIKLSIVGKGTVKEDDFDEWTSTSSVKDYDISSISGSEDEDDTEFGHLSDLTRGLLASEKQKLFLHLPNGELISFWKCLLLGDSEKVILEHDLSAPMKDDDMPCVAVREVTENLLNVIHEPRDNTHFRVMLLASGGHFALISKNCLL